MITMTMQERIESKEFRMGIIPQRGGNREVELSMSVEWHHPHDGTVQIVIRQSDVMERYVTVETLRERFQRFIDESRAIPVDLSKVHVMPSGRR